MSDLRLSPAALLVATGLLLSACATPSAPVAKTTAAAAPPLAAPQGEEEEVPSESFSDWLAGFRVQAVAAGVRGDTVDTALAGITPNQKVIDLDRRQPEGVVTYADYMSKRLTQARIDKGRRLIAQRRPLLARVEAAYGVPKETIVALWGNETNFGGYTGNFSIIRSLATLAYDGRRAELFTRELIAALKIMETEGFGRDKMTGSWAGAMGQCQFMPSSYLKYAVDFDGDGRPDIWDSEADVFASAANYLHQNGWVMGQPWGRRVQLPPGFDRNLVSLDVQRSVASWGELGLRAANGAPLGRSGLQASVVTPGGAGGPAYLVFQNYRTILRWNRSTYFAMSVLQLSDALDDGTAPVL